MARLDPLDIPKAKPSEIQAALRQAILRGYGDKTENRAKVWASKGYYYVELPDGLKLTLQRKHILAAIKLLRAGPQKEG